MWLWLMEQLVPMACLGLPYPPTFLKRLANPPKLRSLCLLPVALALVSPQIKSGKEIYANPSMKTIRSLRA